jgi:cell shape-determining protein MreC
MPDFQTLIAILTASQEFFSAMTPSNLETTNSSFPNGQDSSSRGLLSALWQWINSYGGLSDLRKSNEELRRETEALKQQNARLAELESKLDTVLQSSASNLTPTPSTDNN